jgi:hypothetical protein
VQGDHAGPQAASGPALARLPEFFRELLREGGTDLFDAVENALVHAAFEHAHHNQVRTAKVLGVTRNMVRTQLKRHGLLAGGATDAGVGEDAAEGEPVVVDAAPSALADGADEPGADRAPDPAAPAIGTVGRSGGGFAFSPVQARFPYL